MNIYSRPSSLAPKKCRGDTQRRAVIGDFNLKVESKVLWVKSFKNTFPDESEEIRVAESKKEKLFMVLLLEFSTLNNGLVRFRTSNIFTVFPCEIPMKFPSMRSRD